MSSGSAEFASGTVIDRRAQGAGIQGRGSVYVIRSDEGFDYTCEYMDLVTMLFRSLSVGDKVRFTPVEDERGMRQARNIIKLTQTPMESLYGTNTTPAVPPKA